MTFLILRLVSLFRPSFSSNIVSSLADEVCILRMPVCGDEGGKWGVQLGSVLRGLTCGAVFGPCVKGTGVAASERLRSPGDTGAHSGRCCARSPHGWS